MYNIKVMTELNKFTIIHYRSEYYRKSILNKSLDNPMIHLQAETGS